MNSLPPALRPIYTTAQPNENILLYDGLLEISSNINNNQVQIEGSGKLKYVWFPSPCIKFEFSNQDRDIDIISYALFNDFPISLTLSDLGISLDVSVATSSSGGNKGNFISGRIKEAVVQGKGQDLAYVLFHVVNFHDFIGRPPSILEQDIGGRHIERIVFEAEEWKITLDQLETTTDKDIVQSLKSQGGFLITHVGKLEKLDGQNFSGKEVGEFLEKFADFLSFARGFSVPVILYIGYDAKENQIWKHWEGSVGDSWKGVFSWCPKQKGNKLAEVFPGFLTWWQNWEESARLGLYWYLEANYNSLTEQNIILAQIALELIAWVFIVEKEKTVSKKEFDKLPASDKLRKLFSQFSIPLEIPCSNNVLNDLRQLASESNWKDGSHALTAMRNAIVHPETKKRNQIYSATFEAKIGNAHLGLWYLELTLLAMFKYQGSYANRLEKGNLEVVPWSKNGQS